MVSKVRWASLVAQMVKRLPTMRQTQVQSLGWEDPLEKEMATHSSTLSQKISWTEEHGRLQFMGLQRVRHNSATSLQMVPELVSACSWVGTWSKGSWGWCFLTDFWSWDLESLSLGHGYFRASVCSLVGEAWIFACRTLMIWGDDIGPLVGREGLKHSLCLCPPTGGWNRVLGYVTMLCEVSWSWC